VHTVDPSAGENEPGRQFVHVPAALAAVAFENLPAVHAVQAVSAVEVEYVPAGQERQDELPFCGW